MRPRQSDLNIVLYIIYRFKKDISSLGEVKQSISFCEYLQRYFEFICTRECRRRCCQFCCFVLFLLCFCLFVLLLLFCFVFFILFFLGGGGVFGKREIYNRGARKANVDGYNVRIMIRHSDFMADFVFTFLSSFCRANSFLRWLFDCVCLL